MSVHRVCGVEVEGIRSSGSVTGGCELPCWCWELKLGLLQEHPVDSATEPAPKLLKLKRESVACLDKAPCVTGHREGSKHIDYG